MIQWKRTLLLFILVNVCLFLPLLYCDLALCIYPCLDIIFKSKQNRMPPKRSKKNEQRPAQRDPHPVLSIDQHFRRAGEGDSAAEVARKLNTGFIEQPEVLNNSLACFVLRACGLGVAVGRVDFADISGSFGAILKLVDQKQLIVPPESSLLANAKDKSHERYSQRLKEFFSLLLGEESEAMRERNNNKMLVFLSEWLSILGRSHKRSIRLQATILVRMLVESLTAHFTTFINRRQSRKAAELVREVESYLPLIEDRLRDVDGQIREVAQGTLKGALLAMESDLASQKTLEDVFLSLLKFKEAAKAVEGALELLIAIAFRSPRLKKHILAFVKTHLPVFEQISLKPKKGGVLSLRLMTQLHRLDSQAGLLSPRHISRVFQCYELQGFTAGLQVAVEAFYASVFSSPEELAANRTIVAVQINNLINNFPLNVRKGILTQFCLSAHVSIDQVLTVPQLFAVLTSEAYSFNGEEVELKERDLVGWTLIMESFVAHVQAKMEKAESEGERAEAEYTRWRAIADEYNTHLLGSVKHLIHEQMRGELTKCFLRLMGRLVMPVGSAFEGQLAYMYERIVAIFERESDPEVFREVVGIFHRTNTHSISLLTKGLQGTGRNRRDRTIVLLKKIAILSKYFVEELVSVQMVREMIGCFQETEGSSVKLELLLGLFMVHQWWVNCLAELDRSEWQLGEYRQVRQEVISFLFALLHAPRESPLLRLQALNTLLQMLTIICDWRFSGQPEIYYNLEEQQIEAIYRLLNAEVGLPLEQGEDETKDFTRMMNSLSFEEHDREVVIPRIFALLESCPKLAAHPTSLRLIAGALLAEEDQLEDPNATRQNLSLTRNLSISFERSPYASVYVRDKPASRYLDRLAEKQVHPDNHGSFFFWQVVQGVLQELKGDQRTTEAFISRAIDLYFRRKLPIPSYMASMSKVLVFVVAQIDRIYEEARFETFAAVRIILGKILRQRKLNKQAVKRVYKFLKDKPEPASAKEAYKGLLAMLEKGCKGGLPEEEEAEEVNEVVRAENVRETRSMSKRDALNLTQRELDE